MNLFIDTHLNDVVVILSENDIILNKEIIRNEKQNSKIIMPLIKKILADKIPESITIVNGPGSFTGVRLGVTIAKTLAYTWQIPIRSITTLECLAISTNELEKIVAFTDNNGYYIGIFDQNCNLIGNYEYLNKLELEKFSKKYNVLTDLEINYEKVIKVANKKQILNPHEVNPIYIKKIDVEK